MSTFITEQNFNTNKNPKFNFENVNNVNSLEKSTIDNEDSSNRISSNGEGILHTETSTIKTYSNMEIISDGEEGKIRSVFDDPDILTTCDVEEGNNSAKVETENGNASLLVTAFGIGKNITVSFNEKLLSSWKMLPSLQFKNI